MCVNKGVNQLLNFKNKYTSKCPLEITQNKKTNISTSRLVQKLDIGSKNKSKICKPGPVYEDYKVFNVYHLSRTAIAHSLQQPTLQI